MWAFGEKGMKVEQCMDLVLYGFFIIPMLVSSPAMKMVCICFLVHLLVYIKEKQLFVLEK